MKTVLLGDICTRVTSGGTPSTRKPEFYDGNIPWLRTQEINFGRIYSTEKTITEAGVKGSSAKLIPKNSVIVAMYGATAGKVAINKIPLTTNQACCNLIINPSEADYEYVYYYLLSNYERLLGSATGAAQQNLGTKQIAAMSIFLPRLSGQKAIANILGKIDKKIEVNRRMNETLEQIGQALFKRYFIDNPESKTWPRGKLGDILQALESGSRPKGGALDSGVPSVGAENIEGLGIYDYSKEKYVSEELFNNLQQGIIESEDVLLYKDGAYVGKKSLFMDGFPHKKCCVNEHVFILRTNDKLPSQFYLYFWLDQEEITRQIIDSGVKAAQPGINQANVRNLHVLLPSIKNIAEFNELVRPIMKKLFLNANQARELSKLRDSLLPRLISGKIKI